MPHKEGLTLKEVELSRKNYGSNELISIKQKSFLSLFFSSLGDPIIKILLIALGIKIVFLFRNFDWFETIGIVIAIFLASFVSTISEYGSEEAFAKLQKEASKIKAKVKRERKIIEINIEDVVVGDIILLASGDFIPADGYLIEGELLIDESSLNGETKEAKKTSIKKDAKWAKENEVLRGSVIYSGEALMEVRQVGDKTLYGQLAQELQEAQPDSPLKIRLRTLAKVISRIGYLGAILVGISYLFSIIFIGNNFEIEKIMATLTNIPLMSSHLLYVATLSVTIIVVAVPEGLPMMITLVLSSNMKKMLKRQVLVRKLVGIETAGSINILFTDKTGTLTKGKLEVVSLVNGNLENFKNEEELKKSPIFSKLVHDSFVYNNMSVYSSEGKIIGGNTTDRALLSFFKNHIKHTNVQKIVSIPFDSALKYSSTTIKNEDKKEITLVKGAPEKLLKYCLYYYNKQGKKEILNKKIIEEEIKNLTTKGMRLLLLATSENLIKENNLTSLTLVGIALIKDELRSETKKAIALVHKAGIRTVMITGDAKETALSIAQEINLINTKEDIILTSSDLKNLNDEEVKAIIPNLKVLARALPSDKSRLVRLSQELGLVVAMTGDGVNDAPALKKSDVGFAMGSGTEVAKEASDIVILDDNFYSITEAILFGRTIFKSIRKFIIFQLTVNMCALALSIICPFIGINTPITIIQMLWINMIMDTFSGLAFSFEPPLAEYMEERPKTKTEPIINNYMYSQIIWTGLYSAFLCLLFLKLPFFSNMMRTGNKYLMTAYFALFIFIDIFNAFNARTERINIFANILKNKIFLFVIGFIVTTQIYLIYYGGSLFRTYGLTLKELLLIIFLAWTVIPFDWLRKKVFKRKQKLKNLI